MERDLHYYHEQSTYAHLCMHKDEVIDRLLQNLRSEFHTRMQQEKQNREYFLTNILPNIAAATLGIVFAPIAVVAVPLFVTASLVKQLQPGFGRIVQEKMASLHWPMKT